MQTIKGPGLFLAQFAGDTAPFNDFGAICRWAAGHGYKGVQVPTRGANFLDLDLAATSQTYCDEVKGIAAEAGVDDFLAEATPQGKLDMIRELQRKPCGESAFRHSY